MLILAFLGNDTKEKINFLKKKEFHKMFKHIDEDQLLEEYGGKLKLPERIWPPTDTYTPDVRRSIEPVLEPETATCKYTYCAGANEAKKPLHSTAQDRFISEEEFETGGCLIPLEPRKSKLPTNGSFPFKSRNQHSQMPIEEIHEQSRLSDNSNRQIMNPAITMPSSPLKTDQRLMDLTQINSASTAVAESDIKMTMKQIPGPTLGTSQHQKTTKKCQCQCTLI